ncbi:hypothetical protein Q8G38_16005 [Halomonas venusta]|uniref:hypothetical protein n=1 Tax=Vreelandella venusta TaxID=44935 RepID=UPI00295EAF85|nr:hypothetical protein [Halomonas venusta]MDW0360817.1 hypothetical protein [Halomonas venusta]
MTKTCSICGFTKPIDQFHRLKTSKDGRRSQCKSCRRPIEFVESQREYERLSLSGLKKCTSCGEIKNFDCFYDSNSSRGGKYCKCAECCREHSRSWYTENRDRSLEIKKVYRKNNTERIKETNLKWHNENKEYLKNLRKESYYSDIESSRKKGREDARRRRLNDPDRERKKRRKYHQENKSRKSYRTNRLIRVVLNNFIRRAGVKKSCSTSEALGYSGEQLSAHLERQFVNGMSWDNYGTEWHVDHIVSVSEHIKNGETDPAVVNCLSNLRPAWAAENLRKGDKRMYLI